MTSHGELWTSGRSLWSYELSFPMDTHRAYLVLVGLLSAEGQWRNRTLSLYRRHSWPKAHFHVGLGSCCKLSNLNLFHLGLTHHFSRLYQRSWTTFQYVPVWYQCQCLQPQIEAEPSVCTARLLMIWHHWMCTSQTNHSCSLRLTSVGTDSLSY
jgi:hypothetical protein